MPKNKSLICIFLCIVSFFSFSLFCKKNLHDSKYLVYKPINLVKVTNISYQNREDLLAYDYLIKAGWYGERAALGGFLPQFSIFADSGKSSKPSTTGSGVSPFPRESIGLEASQLIFSYAGPLIQYKIAQEETNISRTKKDQLQYLIRINTENSFLEVKKILLKKEFIKSLDKSSQETFNQNISKKEVGFLNKTQWDNAKFQYFQGQTGVQNYPEDINASISILKRETNSSIDTNSISLAYKDLIKIQLDSIEYYYKKAMLHRPDLTEQKHRIKQADYSERFYRYKYIPEIYFGATMQKNRIFDCTPQALLQTNIPFDNEPLFWHVGLKVVWNFDGLSSFNKSREFDNLSTNIKFRKRDLELNILKDIEVTYDQLTIQLNLLKPTQLQYKTSKTQLNSKKIEYDVGLAPLFEYQQSKLGCEKAEFDLISLKIDIRKNYQKLLFLCGYPPEISS